MGLWIAMAVLTAAATVAVLAPLFRTRSEPAAAAPAEAAIYRDQLSEIRRDVARGVLAEAEAEAARTEVARRLLGAGERTAAASPPSRSRLWLAAAVALVGVPALSLAGYLYLGSPAAPDMPLASRLSGPPSERDPAALAAMLERTVMANPTDARGWRFLIPVYTQLGRSDDAGRAYLNLIRLTGRESDPNGEIGLALGDAIVRREGEVGALATSIFTVVQTINPADTWSRFYLAVGLTEGGKTAEAAAAWRALLADSPPEGAPWTEYARSQLAALEQNLAAGAQPSTPPAAGPSDEDVNAAAELPPDQRQQMISAMVGRLAARLAESPDDPLGWVQLMRSYMVLGEADAARQALADARAALSGKPEALAAVEAGAKALAIQ